MMKYAVITSQYMGDCVSFAVLFDEETFLENMRAFLDEAERYKRDPHLREHSFCYGDLDLAYYKPGRTRYMVNDIGGDFYIRLTDTVTGAIDISAEESAFAKNHWPKPTKKDQGKISEHHSYDALRKIVQKHFVFA